MTRRRLRLWSPTEAASIGSKITCGAIQFTSIGRLVKGRRTFQVNPKALSNKHSSRVEPISLGDAMQKALSNSSRRKWAGRNLALALTVAAVALTCACGGGSNPDFAPSTPSNPVPGVSLQRINITPSSSIIQMSESRQLFAQGVYSDGSTQDVSSLVTWSASSLPSMTDFVSVTSGGVATGMGIGATNITATIGSVTAIRTLTVGTNGFSSSTMAILSVPKGNSEIDAAYLPQQVKINGSYAVQEVNLDADQFSSLLPVPVALMASDR